jgi:hypothetical protein
MLPSPIVNSVLAILRMALPSPIFNSVLGSLLGYFENGVSLAHFQQCAGQVAGQFLEWRYSSPFLTVCWAGCWAILRMALLSPIFNSELGNFENGVTFAHF